MKLPLFLSKSHLKNCRQYGIVIRIPCYFYSGSWIVIEILSHFFSAFEQWSRGNLWLLSAIAVLGLLMGISRFLHKCGKMLSVSQKLSATDTLIEIRVDDIFNIEGAFIISTSTTFDTDMSDSLVSESVQEQFTRKYYDNTAHLDHDIEKELEDREYTVIEDNRKGKKSVTTLATSLNYNCKSK